MNQPLSRRKFVAATAAGPAVVASGQNTKLALLGGAPVRSGSFPAWPRIDALDEKEWMTVLRDRKWFRGNGAQVGRFETAYAKLTGAGHCLATMNGTSALIVSLAALGVGPGDEVIVPPYTFVATINSVLMRNAVPVFVDSDIETSQIDARKIEAAITPRTRAIMPVHLGGSVADMDAVLAVARKRNIPVIEDACQSHLAEWRGKRAGTLGATGCFSFQVSKNLSSGEGGAVLANDPEIIERCYAFHNNGRGRKVDSYNFSYQLNGANLRMTEFQATLLLCGMTRLQEQAKMREQNAQYLTSMLRQIPGIAPAKMYEGCTRNAYHLYMLRYDKAAFAGIPRATFLKALGAEGVPASSGYSPLNKEPFLKNVLNSRGFQAVYSRDYIKAWESNNHCPANDRLCEEAVWLTQNVLLASRGEMEQIAEAVRKVQKQAVDLRKA
ncbi:MAG: DegT/DnrJ/EryC1/StrS family aminotransferase [Acidobacteria bacterium]|nr:DegT/DnrJ/EryC1/StrS family aminotransferase [Acidobacteriota bacterium]